MGGCKKDMSRSNLLISIESSNSLSAKSHAKLLQERLRAEGINAQYVSLDSLARPSASLLKAYHAGTLGDQDALGAYLPSLLLGLDRHTQLAEGRAEAAVTIVDRALLSEMANNGHFIQNKGERLGFYTWIDQINTGIIHSHRPDIAIYITAKNEQKNTPYFEEVLSLFPKYISLKLNDTDSLTSNITSIWKGFESTFKSLPKSETQQRYIAKHLQFFPNQGNRNALKKAIRQDNLDELETLPRAFKNEPHATVQLVAHNTSALTQIILLQAHTGSLPTALTDFQALTLKNSRGHYNYITPRDLDADSAKLFEDTMHKIFDIYSLAHKKLKSYIRENKLQPKLLAATDTLLPLATRVSTLYENAPITTGAINELQSYGLLETSDLAQEYSELVAPSEKKATKSLEHSYGIFVENATITQTQPLNELDVLSLFSANPEHSNYVQGAQQLSKLLQSEVNKAPISKVLGQYRYVVTASLTQNDIFKLLSITPGALLSLDRPSPRGGYEAGAIFSEAGLGDEYDKCFDLSYELYSNLQKAGFETQAEYATLFGHKQLCTLSFTANDFVLILENKDLSSGINELTRVLVEEVRIKHPLLSNTIIDA